ncbi:hypothetical protein PBAL39_11907 [Pedobacter sp. BAL39]|uniref:hypothetical protein n=1 Tax=Pedobacter sp. BAL39 TaxID=391596 RepID=UPI0001559D14|nr:hypothetical protein [Pedobacter sp. BAL39]EDM36408.1 hypothetical protein PBAL39_11907 [Pedobacter sp. BAL39]
MKKLMLGMIGVSFLIQATMAQEAPEMPAAQEQMAVTFPLPLPKIEVAIRPVRVKINVVSTTTTTTSDNVGQQHDADDPMRSRTITKSFSLDQSDKVLLSNKYGEVQVKTWDKKEARVDVTIKAWAKSENDAQQMLEDVSITAAKEGDEVTFRTNVGGGNYSRGKNGSKSWRREVRIDYVLFLPASAALSLSNQYGNVVMGNFSGPLYVKAQYGNFNAGRLMNNNNYVSVQYGKADIQELNKAVVKQQYGSGLAIAVVGTLDLNAQYAGVNIGSIKGDAVIRQQYGSGLTIGSVDNLDLDAQYTNVNIGTVSGNAAIKQQYNNITIANVGKLNLNGQYTTVKVGTLKGDANFRMDYNRLSVDQITSACRALAVKANYVGVSLGFADNYHGDFSVRTNYGSFKYGDAVAAKSDRDPDDKSYSSTRNYTGTIGRGGSGKVSLSTDYGSVLFK